MSLSTTSSPRVVSPERNDDWRLIEDKKQRKKVQDRLAQRARRRRIAESKAKLKEAKPEPEIDAVQLSMELVAATSPGVPSITSEYHLLPRSFMSALTALYNNSRLMGKPPMNTCSMGLARADLAVPESLRPTQLQITTMHYGTVDHFPFRVFRDNLILMQELIDPQEFLYDIINMHSFWVIDGRPSWDPAAWRMGRDYEKKWGYLFFGGQPPPTAGLPGIPAGIIGATAGWISVE